jgi:hypothetical protein
MAQPMRVRTGLVTFAAVLAIIAGAYNALSGIAAIAEDDRTEQISEVLYGVDITVWGWVWLIIGVVQIVVGVMIYQRHPLGQILGLVWAFLNATLAVFLIFSFPLWAILIVGLNVLVIYALTAKPEEFA